MRLNIDKALIKEPRVLLALAFFALVLAKAFLSLKFQSPWFFTDEVTYSKMAADIFGSEYPILPQGYPLILSIAYLFSDKMMTVYHSMLIINSLLSSLIIFPSYFILSKYCSRNFSLMGAITVATLPSLTLYSFLIMTENLFIPLFVFSLWFLLEAYETEKRSWIVLSALSVLLLFIARQTGVLMVAAMAISFVYYLHIGKQSGDIKQSVLALSQRTYLIILIISLALFGLAFIWSSPIYYFKGLYNYALSYGHVFLNIFGDANSLKNFLVLLRNEIGYLIVASYFIFFYALIIFFLSLFSGATHLSHSTISDWFNPLGDDKKRTLKPVVIYYLLSSVILVFVTTIHAYLNKLEIVGRYIDPIIPGIFLFGLIGIYQLHETSKKTNYKKEIILAIILSIILFFNFPDPISSSLPIYHIYFLKIQLSDPNWIAYPALAAGFFLLLDLYGGPERRYGWKSFFAVLMIFSILASAYTYYGELVYYSDRNQAENQIGAYLNAHSDKDSTIIMDEEIKQNSWYFGSLTEFWTKGKIFYQPVNENVSSWISDRTNVYIITSKLLPLKRLAISPRGYYLY